MYTGQQIQPDEIVGLEPSAQSRRVNNEGDQRRDAPERNRFESPAPRLSHLASKPIVFTTTPSSRRSFPVGGSALSRANSTVALPLPNARAGTSRMYRNSPVRSVAATPR